MNAHYATLKHLKNPYFPLDISVHKFTSYAVFSGNINKIYSELQTKKLPWNEKELILISYEFLLLERVRRTLCFTSAFYFMAMGKTQIFNTFLNLKIEKNDECSNIYQRDRDAKFDKLRVILLNANVIRHRVSFRDDKWSVQHFWFDSIITSQ